MLKDYRGAYIMAFAAYNAGRGRLKEWLAKSGDPRDPSKRPGDAAISATFLLSFIDPSIRAGVMAK